MTIWGGDPLSSIHAISDVDDVELNNIRFYFFYVDFYTRSYSLKFHLQNFLLMNLKKIWAIYILPRFELIL